MKITITGTALKASIRILRRAKDAIRRSYKGCKNHDILIVNIYSYTKGKYPSINYNSNLTAFETWPCGSAGSYWIDKIPEKDYI